MKLAWAKAQLRCCRICPRDCRVDRRAGERGWCKAGETPAVYMDYVHFGEETEIAPSHTLFLTGCNLDCSFCHTAPERKEHGAAVLTPDRLSRIIEKGRWEGARNINLLGGEPMVNLPGLLFVFSQMTGMPPLVWNTNLYTTDETLTIMWDIPDIFLVDLKFGNDVCGMAVCGAPDYWTVVTGRLQELLGLAGPEAIIIRHLVLPGHLDCCTRPILEWLAREMAGVRVHLKTDYMVMPRVRGQSLGRFLTPREISAAKDAFADSGLRSVETVEPASALKWAAQNRLKKGTAKHVGDVEVVIAPDGRVFVQHGVRGLAEVGDRLMNDEC